MGGLVIHAMLDLWLKLSEDAAWNSFIAGNELSTTRGWPKRDTKWMSPNLNLQRVLHFLAPQGALYGIDRPSIYQ